ncbi:pimeloyl-ACP methyl ester carboxylesterase [Paenibacillus castaneae]|uniref:alpha/beta fold hydrolase n=1 Tax=Paenibacillus castaneae TaxID=474957 RepID=UPI000C9CDFDB|nr:alpha/beta hydrolase [Paenibacillus castaneae]NIK79171.1 pimeloyl-ACP methyl ester carboxylesterase [Paenibacillus castaneae]
MNQTISIFRSDSKQPVYHAVYDQALIEWPIPYETRYVETSYGDTHIIICGDSQLPPLLLIHGMTATSHMWSVNISELSRSFYVHCIDVPGDFGKSTVQQPLSNKESAARWLSELADGLQFDTFHLMGHSMGGFLSLNFALVHPSRVRSLILLAPAGSFAPLHWMFFLKVFPAVLFPKRWLILLAFKWFMSKHNRLNLLSESYKELLVAGYQCCVPQLKVVPSVFSKEELSRLHVPTLFLVGEDEVIYRSIEKAKSHAHHIPNITIVTLSRAGHLLSVEQKERVNGLVIDFLNQQAGNTA